MSSVLKAIVKLTLSLLLNVVCSAGSLTMSGTDLNGTWRLNEAESDNTRQKLEQSMNKRHGLLGEIKRKKLSGALSNFEVPDVLVIKQDGARFIVAAANGRTRSFTTDGHERTVSTQNGKTLQTKAMESEGRIVVEISSNEKRGRIVETYASSSDGRRLNVSIQIESERLTKPVLIRRVYDRSTRA